MHLSVPNLDLPTAAMAATLLLTKAAVAAENETPSPPDAEPRAEEIVFDHTCTHPEIPLDSAPLPALSLDPVHEARFQPPLPSTHTHSGTTKMHLLVNEQGRVVRARVAAPSGDRLMDAAILRSVEEWRFRPRYLDGKPVCAWGSYALTYAFKHENDIAPEPSTPPRDRQ